MTMPRRDVATIVVYAIPTVGLMLQGFLYLTTSQFMSYHGAALDVAWTDLPGNHQAFLLGVLKGMGAGSVGVTLALFIMLGGPFRRGESWSRWAIPLVGAVFTSLTAYAAYTIDVGTPASTPWRQTLGLTALYVAGGLISHVPTRKMGYARRR
jgi:hypothetical protein